MKNPRDEALRKRLQESLVRLAADPSNGISRVLDAAEAARLGAFPEAAFVVEFSRGYYFGAALDGPLLSPATSRGTHGYLPTHPDMHAVFYAKGKGIAAGRNLGIIDMRQLAPTFAALLDVALPAATQPALPVTTGKR